MINSINTANQAIEQKPSTIVPSKSPPAKETTNVYSLEQVREEKQVDEKALEEKRQSEDTKDDKLLTQEMLDEIASDIESLHSIGLSFAHHEETGRTMVEVFDRDTDELIRQIPAEDVLNMAAKMDEMIGLLFDEKV